jgi:hypothetical protein
MVIIFRCTTLPIFFQLVLNFMKHICYYCNEIATTKEHTPPKCFFPKKKDLPSGSPDYRKNLITVPSCEKHNTGRSKDDEYTAVHGEWLGIAQQYLTLVLIPVMELLAD